MAFLRFAHARVIHPQVSKTQWQNIRTAAKSEQATSLDLNQNLVARATEFLGQQFDPKSFLLTHATIVASVDVTSPPGVRTGSGVENGFRFNRKYSDFRVTAETDKYINNNYDAWSRGVIAKAFRTFVGGHNFVEHVQVEDLSKGRIIDAVARDIGESVYVDILIATDRKHSDLVTAIENGKMGTLSMGCTVDGTICTKCGHWAADETEMCPHIKYEKGNVFFDEQGRKNRVAELCGHESLDPTGGVTFIEASWVETPAFTGAVLRNVLEPVSDGKVALQLQRVLASPPPQWSAVDLMKAASAQGTTLKREFTSPTRSSFRIGEDQFLAGWDDEAGGEAPAEAPAAPAAPAAPFKDVEDELYKVMLDKVKKRLRTDLSQGGADEPSHAPTESTNETLNKQAAAQRLYEAGLEALLRTASSDVALLDGVAAYNEQVGVKIPVEIYRVALRVGDPTRHGSEGAYKKACQEALGRVPASGEAQVLLRLGRLLFRRGTPGSSSATGKRHEGVN